MTRYAPGVRVLALGPLFLFVLLDDAAALNRASTIEVALVPDCATQSAGGCKTAKLVRPLRPV